MATTTKKTKVTKEKLTIKPTGVTSGSHLSVTYNEDGTVDMKWNWDQLLIEVQEAIATVSPNIIEATETKVKKTRAKKSK